MTHPVLTPAEERVMRLRAQGRTNTETARALERSEQTVKNHLRAVFAKLDVQSLPAALFTLGWVHIPGNALPTYEPCGYVAACGRPFGHRGQHGGFRPIS